VATARSSSSAAPAGSEGRDGRERLEPFGVSGDDLAQGVVGLSGDADRVRSGEALDPRRVQRQHLHVHALVVHVGDALLADVTQPTGDRVVSEAGRHVVAFVAR